MNSTSTTCPKCGSKDSMRGPRFVSDEEGECLVTRCRVCKYTVEQPCADAIERSKEIQQTSIVKIELAEPSDADLGVKQQ